MYSHDPHVSYKYWLAVLIILITVLLTGCAHYKSHKELEAEWWAGVLKRDMKPPPPGYDGGVIIIVPEGSVTYVPDSNGGHYEYITPQP